MPRELIEPKRGDKRYIRRGAKGKCTEKQVDVGRSLAADRRSNSKTLVKKGEGDHGDQKRAGGSIPRAETDVNEYFHRRAVIVREHALKHGRCTADAIAIRRAIATLLRSMRALARCELI